LGNSGLVGREVICELDELVAEAEATNQDECQRDGNEHRGNTGQLWATSEFTRHVSGKLGRMARAKEMKISRPKESPNREHDPASSYEGTCGLRDRWRRVVSVVGGTLS